MTTAVLYSRNELEEQRRVDWTDVKFAILLGFIMVLVKVTFHTHPGWHATRMTTDDVASVLTVGYMIARARRQPGKLDEWGLTTKITRPGILTGIIFAAAGILTLAAGGIMINGNLSLEPAYITQMIEYIPAAFPQQFVMCSVGLATLAKIRFFRGFWRLPLAVGLLFSLAHFWTPARIPGSIIPVQMLLTLPAGFLAAFHFLRFRNILPLTIIHAILYPLLHNWIEVHL
jgi:hypothetical protein